MADETRRQPKQDAGAAPAAEGTGEAQPAAQETRATSPARTKADADAARADAPKQKAPLVRVGDRSAGDGSRTSPRMRFDLLQIGAWVVGLALIVGGLVAVARTGFDELGLFDPVVEVGGQSATPLWALLWLLIGALVLAAATGSVNEQRLRITGVVLAIIGLVFLIESAAFEEYLGVTGDTGSLMLLIGVVLVGLTFVPPLSIKRPGISEE